MDKQQELIQRPTLSFPAYTEPKRPRWLLMLGGLGMLLAVLLLVLAVVNIM